MSAQATRGGATGMTVAPVAGVRLAPFAVDDVDERYVGWLNDPQVVRYTEARWRVHTLESARDYVRESNGDTNVRLFRILVEDGVHVGNVRVSSIDWTHKRADIAIIIGDRSYRGRGVGVRAIELVSEYCFDELGLEKLTAGMYAENEPSIRAFEKAGFVIEGRLAKHHRYGDGRMDGVLMARLRRGASR